MPKPLKVILEIIAALLVLAVAAVGVYIAYMEITYYRIPDRETVRNEGASVGVGTIPVGEELTAATFNIGYGSYTPDYTFFMDTGEMLDGTPTRGEHGVAVSEESVRTLVAGAIETSRTLVNGGAPDFLLLQEVDRDSDRSYHVNQVAEFEDAFNGYAAYYASNFHSGFLAYPIPEFHGRVNAGLLTLSYTEGVSLRRSYPIDESFPTKFFDLDRCFCVTRYPTADGHELVLVNSHMSAYDEGGTIRAQQFELIMGFLAEEAAKGNYVIAGGDWNHALFGSETMYPTQQAMPGWLQVISEDEVPEGLSFVRPDNVEEVPTCRDMDIPYEWGVTYCSTIDGFIVSDNVQATAHTVDCGFENSDHNPVVLTFTLKG